MSKRYRKQKGVHGDGPASAAADAMFMSLDQFEDKLAELLGRKFPPPDPTTGMFDIDAVHAWRRLRHPQIFREQVLTPVTPARNADDVVRLRLAGGQKGG